MNYIDGEKRYILAPIKSKVGDMINSGKNSDIKPGNDITYIFNTCWFFRS